MMKIKINTKNFTQYIRRVIAKLPDAVDAGIQEVAEKAAEIARSHTKGKLAEATQAYRNSATDQGVLANKFYAGWVEYGNGPSGSRIYPTKSSCLHFFLPDGTEIFAKSVAASQPHPFMAEAAAYVEKSGSDIITQHINQALGA